jgi:hypothetical protein
MEFIYRGLAARRDRRPYYERYYGKSFSWLGTETRSIELIIHYIFINYKSVFNALIPVLTTEAPSVSLVVSPIL